MPIYRRWMSCLAAPSRRQRSFISIFFDPLCFSLFFFDFSFFLGGCVQGWNVVLHTPIFMIFFLSPPPRLSISRPPTRCTRPWLGYFPPRQLFKKTSSWFPFLFFERKRHKSVSCVRVNTCVKVTSLSGVKANWWKRMREQRGGNPAENRWVSSSSSPFKNRKCVVLAISINPGDS